MVEFLARFDYWRHPNPEMGGLGPGGFDGMISDRQKGSSLGSRLPPDEMMIDT